MDRCGLSGAILQPANIQINSPWCALHRLAGHMAVKEITIAPGGGAATAYPLFNFTGQIELKGLYGVFTDVTNVVAVTVCYWDVWDAAVAVALTLAAGTNCSTATLNSSVLKVATAGTALTFMKSDQVRISEIATVGSVRQFAGAYMNAKNAVTNSIRFWTTGAAATNCKIKFTAIWACRYPSSTFVAV